MYRIYSDGELIYSPSEKEYTILDGKLKQQLNKSGELTFKIPVTNPSYGRVKLMKSIITLYDDNRLLFRGRAYAPTIDLFNNDTITCEGELAFFNDSIQPPFEYALGATRTLLQYVIDNHNAMVESEKRFLLGRVTVDNSTASGNILRSSTEYLTTWRLLNDKFLKLLGGYFWIRHVGEKVYLDYLSDLDFLGDQKVEQSVNLIDAKRESVTSDLATIVIPLGAKLKDDNGEETGEYLTIESVNNGERRLFDEEAVQRYGAITKVIHHEGITTAENLLIAGRKDLADSLGVNTKITLRAADLSKAGYDVSSFSIGTYIKVKVKNLNIDTRMLVRAISIDLLKPESSILTIGLEEKTLTDWHQDTKNSINKVYKNLKENIKNVTNTAVVRAVREANSNIEQSANEIRTEVSESYYNREKSDELLEKIYTAISQTAEGIELDFNHYKEIQEDINGDTQARFMEITKYIRFVNGNILLGEEGNPLSLRIENDRIIFMENGADIAYWRNRKFYAVDGEFINSLKLGKFAFIPRSTGNLSFTKVVD